jgi:hypothetical protein
VGKTGRALIFAVAARGKPHLYDKPEASDI